MRKKASEENKRRKTLEHIQKIHEYLLENGESKIRELAEYLGLSLSRTRAILSNMDNVNAVGETNNRVYKMDDFHKTKNKPMQ